jgi:phosphatidylglycerol:prolipoprotein diacylglycerol transferase
VIRSGFVFYGGVICGIAALYLLSKKYKIKFALLADIIAIGVPLGHAFGRLGCFFYGCCYGRPSESFMGVLFPPDSPAGYLGAKVIPTQLISSFFLFLLFFLLLAFRKRKKFDGQIVLVYLILYSIFRFIIEFFRGDPRGSILFLSTSQLISLILIAISIFFWVRIRRVEVKGLISGPNQI